MKLLLAGFGARGWGSRALDGGIQHWKEPKGIHKKNASETAQGPSLTTQQHCRERGGRAVTNHGKTWWVFINKAQGHSWHRSSLKGLVEEMIILIS